MVPAVNYASLKIREGEYVFRLRFGCMIFTDIGVGKGCGA